MWCVHASKQRPRCVFTQDLPSNMSFCLPMKLIRFISIFSNLMEKGSSLPWADTLYQATGETRISGAALREYFRPLEDWLRNENLRTQEYVGWLYDGDYCKQSIETAGLQVYGGFYNSAPQTVNSNLLVMLSVLGIITWNRY